MVDSLKIEIGLTGDDAIKRQLADTTTSFAQATSKITQLGNTMAEALEGASVAAKKFGASANELAGVESRIRAVGARAKDSSTPFAELAANIDRVKTSATGATAAAAQHGEALQNTTSHAVTTRAEIIALSMALREVGAGGAANLVSTLGRAGLAFGAIAAAAVVAGAAIKGAFDAAKEAAETAHGLQQLANVSGQSAERLSALQIAFAKGGVSAKQFLQEFTNLELGIQEKSAAIALEVEASADKVASAQLRVRDAFLNVQRVQLQGKQTGLQLQGLQQQLGLLGQIQSAERQRATIAVGDAKARLQTLQVQQQLRDGSIDAEDAAERMASIQAASQKREIEKAKLDVQAAEQAKAGLGEQQQMQERQLQLQGESLRLQQEANKIAKERAEIEQRDAGRNLTKELANDLREVIKAALEIKQGLRTAFDPLTTGENKAKALLAVLIDAKSRGEDVATALASVFQNIESAGERLNLGKALGLDADTVEVLHRGATALNEAATAIQATGQSLTQVDIDKLNNMHAALNNSAAATQAFANAVAAFSADAFVASLDAITAALNRMNAARTPEGRPATPIPELGSPELGIPFASGGLMRGRGGVDTNLAWLSNLEYVMRPAAVKKYGVNFMHRINSMQLPGFAGGGLNLTAPAFAGGGVAGGNNVTIQFPGLPPISGLHASSSVVDELHRAAALAQVRSGGRKPSRYS